MSAFEHSKIDQDLYVKSPTDSSVEGGGMASRPYSLHPAIN